MGEKKDKIRHEAEAYYIDNPEATQTEIAELFKVTQKTISSWCVKYDWEQKRVDFHSSPIKIKQLLQREAILVAQGKPSVVNADAIAKLMSAIDRCEKKANPIVIARILKDVDNFISELDPHFAAKLTDFHKRFLQHRINLELQ